MPSLLHVITYNLVDLIMSPLYACSWNWTYFSPQCEVSALPHDLHSFVILLLENKSMAPTISLRDIRPLVAIWYAAGQGWYRAKVLQICCSSLDLLCSKGSDLLCCRTTAFCAALPHTGRASLSQLQLRIFSPLRKLIRPNSGVPTCSGVLQKVPEQSKTKLTLVRPMPFGLGKLGKDHFMVISWARMKSTTKSGKSSSGAAVLKEGKGPLYILRRPMPMKQENPKRQIAWLSLNFILSTSWVALYSVVCLWVRHRCHTTKSPLFQYIQAYKPFADP